MASIKIYIRELRYKSHTSISFGIDTWNPTNYFYICFIEFIDNEVDSQMYALKQRVKSEIYVDWYREV